jgi:hypothetical protein
MAERAYSITLTETATEADLERWLRDRHLVLGPPDHIGAPRAIMRGSDVDERRNVRVPLWCELDRTAIEGGRVPQRKDDRKAIRGYVLKDGAGRLTVTLYEDTQ